jgi:hypothetical protein
MCLRSILTSEDQVRSTKVAISLITAVVLTIVFGYNFRRDDNIKKDGLH